MVSPISGSHDIAKDGLSSEAAAQRVALAQARIEAAVAAIQSGAEWRNHLKLQSSFHAYSANNVWLVRALEVDGAELLPIAGAGLAVSGCHGVEGADGLSGGHGSHHGSILALGRAVDRRAWQLTALAQYPCPNKSMRISEPAIRR